MEIARIIQNDLKFIDIPIINCNNLIKIYFFILVVSDRGKRIMNKSYRRPYKG